MAAQFSAGRGLVALGLPCLMCAAAAAITASGRRSLASEAEPQESDVGRGSVRRREEESYVQAGGGGDDLSYGSQKKLYEERGTEAASMATAIGEKLQPSGLKATAVGKQYEVLIAELEKDHQHLKTLTDTFRMSLIREHQSRMEEVKNILDGTVNDSKKEHNSTLVQVELGEGTNENATALQLAQVETAKVDQQTPRQEHESSVPDDIHVTMTWNGIARRTPAKGSVHAVGYTSPLVR